MKKYDFLNLLHALEDFSTNKVKIVAETEKSYAGNGIVHQFTEFAKTPEVDAALHPIVGCCGLKNNYLNN